MANRRGTICPSDAAKYVDPDNWRDLMEPTRMAARRLAHGGRIRILQRGEPVNPDAMRGPVRLAKQSG